MYPYGRGGQATRIPRGCAILGGVEAGQDLIIDGRVDGHITLPDHHLSISASAVVSARIVARSVTISGSVNGNILARERIDVQASAHVRGHLTTPAITLEEGARFNGSVDPHRTEAALHVAKYRQRTQGETGEPVSR
jgi:cytoskeletal protein CcmA (bactofilin family)